MIDPVIIGNATLYLGDAREIAPALGKCDLIVSDIPYPLESGGNTTGDMGGKFSKAVYDNSGSIIDCDIPFNEIMAVCAGMLDQGHAYFMVNNRHLANCENAALVAGFRFHNWLVWDKGTGTPSRWYMKNCEFTFFGFRGKGQYIADCGSRQLITCPNVLNGVHATQKPVALMEHYIRNSSKAGQIVVDPFMGSGTTGIAALNLGRKFIGIEKDPEHFANAVRRLQAETSQSSLIWEAA